MSCIVSRAFPWSPVVAPNPNIPFEFYLNLISPVWYPRQFLQCPLQRNGVLRPRPLIYNPRNSMVDVVQVKSNSISSPPLPTFIGDMSQKIDLACTPKKPETKSHLNERNKRFHPYRTMVDTAVKPINMTPSQSFIRENPKETLFVGTSTAATETKCQKHEKSLNVKKYECKYCGRCFSRSNTLVTHERIHTGEKPFECNICQQKFRQYGNLVRHKIIHTNLKPFSCHVCKHTFNRKSNLKTHMQIHCRNK